MSALPTLKYCFYSDESLTGTPGPTLNFTRSSTATWYGNDGLIKTAAISTPRFDHRAATKQPLGLLMESASTNKLLRSEEFNNSVWFKNNTTVTANVATSPDGTTSADDILQTDGFGYCRQNVAVTANTNHTYSIYLKKGTTGGNARWVQLSCYNSGVTIKFSGWFDIANGVTGSTENTGGATIRSLYIEDVGNGYYKCDITGSLQNSQTSMLCSVSAKTADNTQNKDQTNSIQAWGAMLEQRSFVSSYVKTEGATATRASETAGSGNIGWHNTDENIGTWYSRATPGRYVGLGGTSDRSTAYIRYNSVHRMDPFANVNQDTELKAWSAGGTATLSTHTLVENLSGNVEFQAVTAHALNDVATFINGNAGQTDSTFDRTSGTPYISYAIGKCGTGTETPWDGHIAEIRYYPVRFDNETSQDMSTGIFPEGGARNWLTVSRRKLDRPPTKRVYPKPKPNMRSTYE